MAYSFDRDFDGGEAGTLRIPKGIAYYHGLARRVKERSKKTDEMFQRNLEYIAYLGGRLREKIIESASMVRNPDYKDIRKVLLKIYKEGRVSCFRHESGKELGFSELRMFLYDMFCRKV